MVAYCKLLTHSIYMASSKRVKKQLPLFSTDIQEKKILKAKIVKKKSLPKKASESRKTLSKQSIASKAIGKKIKKSPLSPRKGRKKAPVQRKLKKREKGRIELRLWSEILNETDTVSEKDKTLFFHSKTEAAKALQEIYATLKKYS